MTENSKEKKYDNVSIPTGLIKEVDELIKDKKNKYKSRADFCTIAIHLLLKEEQTK